MRAPQTSSSFPSLLGATALLLATEAASSQTLMLEEIMVTAQKREQDLQEIPAALVAFSGSSIEEAGWRNVGQVQDAVPSLEIGGESKMRPFVSIRGVGTRKFDIGTDGSVGLFIDEIYNSRFTSIMGTLLDVERIEVLKGPQGTLYGRNTIGGAINIISRQPSDELEGRLSARVGNYDLWEIGGTVSGPLAGDSLLARLSASTSEQDGVYDDTVSGENGNEKRSSARLSLVFRPNDDWDLNFIGDYSSNESDAVLTDVQPGEVFGVLLISPADPRVPAVVADGQKDRYSNAFGRPGYYDQEMTQLSFKAKHQGEAFDFLSITSYTDEEYSEARDFDGTVLGGWDFFVDQESDQFSQEFRFSSVGGGFGTLDDRLNWVFGLYYFEDDAQRSDAVETTPDSVLYFPPLGGAPDVTSFFVDLDTTSYAAYGQATYAITENLNLTVGLRYSDDEKDFIYTALTDTPVPPVAASFQVEDTLSYDSTDPRVTLDYHINENSMIWATYSTGYKSGGVQIAVGTPEAALKSFDPEELTNYEIGFKSELWDRRLQLNASAFMYEYKDQQMQSIVLINGAPVALTENAAKSDMNGIEIDMLALLTESLTLDLKYAWLDAEFDSFVAADGDYSGNKMPAAPEHAASIALTHVTALDSWGELTLNVRYAWKDDQYFNFRNNELSFQESYGIVNLGAWWDLPDEKTRIRVYCDNCGDEEYMHTFTAFPDPFGGGRRTWAYGRQYGMELSYNF